jgi:glycosyltransferase involved in cell wall biosynthesis
MLSNSVLRYLLSDNRFKLIRELRSTNSSSPRLSCVIPVFNQEKIIYGHLSSIVNNARGSIELVIIDDASKDSSRKEILKFISDLSPLMENILRVRLYRTNISVYESRAEDFGFRVSQGQFVLGIQADMKILQLGFDDELVGVLSCRPNFSILSCRGTHSFYHLDNGLTYRGRELSDRIDFRFIVRPIVRLKQKLALIYTQLLQKSQENKNLPIHVNEPNHPILEWEKIFPSKDSESAGWLGGNIDFLPYEYDSSFAEKLWRFSQRIWVGETVMRGPIFMRRQHYLESGGYNTKAFFQGLDEHDLSIRFKSKSKQVGFYPIYFASPSALRVAGKTGKRSFTQRISSQIHASVRRKYFKDSELIKFLNSKGPQ